MSLVPVGGWTHVNSTAAMVEFSNTFVIAATVVAILIIYISFKVPSRSHPAAAAAAARYS